MSIQYIKNPSLYALQILFDPKTIWYLLFDQFFLNLFPFSNRCWNYQLIRLKTCPNLGMKRQNTFEGTPLVQQCDVSTTVNTGPPPQPLPQPPVQPQMTATTYYQQPDFDQYCMTVPYVDYSYDYHVYPPSPSIVPSSYIAAEGVVYQTVLSPATTVLPTPPPPSTAI